ncbi:MAG: ABC transporter ATP-binding protein [Firmicutes bacterium]|nr:ABC transporter ATP-binding protein [Bacillota bacterium]
MLRILLKYWHFALLAIVFMICEVTVDMIQPKLMATIVDDGILGLSGNGQPDLQLISSTGVIMLLVVLAGGLSGILSGTMANLCSQRFGNDIRKKCFERIMHLSFEQTDAFTTGSLITRITNDVTQLERLVQQSVRGFVRCIMFMVVGTITLLSLNQHFLVILAIAFPLVLIDIIFILWRTNPLFMRLQKRIDNMNTVIRENINGARLVKAFIQEDREEDRFAKANQALVKTQLRILILMSYLRPVMNIILNLATVALIWIGAIHVQRGGMQPGEVMAAVTYISQILNGMMMLAMIFQTLSRGTASYRRIKEVIDTEPVIQDGPATTVPSDGSVEFRSVSFTYPKRADETAELSRSISPDPEGKAPEEELGEDGRVLRSIDLRIESGQTLAIVGATGSGKTSLVNLIPRFYDATEGTILVGGQDVRSYKLTDLREKVAYVPQKNELFSTNIRDNIRIGRPDAGEEEIRFAARCAQAEDFILQQPEGYDTAVAEGGMSLSGGQRQRIAIARALLKASDILILDDSTSALDLKTEAAFYDALHEHFDDLTCIVIAQRITTARRADRIAVLDHGKLVGCGTHVELMAGCPVYQDICSSQTGA